MTREEAIKILKAIRVYECYPKSASEETKEAIDMAIEALTHDIHTETHGVCSDLISRDDAVKTVIRKCSPICAWQVGTQQYPDCVVAEINSLPSAEAVQGYTEWLEKIIVEAETFEWLCEDATGEEWCEKNCNFASIQAECLRHLYEGYFGY